MASDDLPIPVSSSMPLRDPSPEPTVYATPTPAETPDVQQPAQQVQQVVQATPREKTPQEIAAEQEIQRRIDAARTSSRMALEMPQTATATTTTDGKKSSVVTVGYESSMSDDEIDQTTVIPVRLITAIDSTLPGIVKAQVTTPVFDSKTHQNVVIPAGTFVVGQYQSQTVDGQARMCVLWSRLLFPDGRKFGMGEAQGSGLKGESGMSASVDTHAGRAFGNAMLYTMLTAAGNIASDAVNRRSTVIDIGSATQSIQEPTRQPPTMHLYPGTLFNIEVTQDLPLGKYAE